jgi:ATP-dependent helicase/nuclease subunit B
VFGPVAAHPATVQALAAAHRELRKVDEAALDGIAGCGEPVPADLARLRRRVTGLLAEDWYNAMGLRSAAAAVLHGEPHRAARWA